MRSPGARAASSNTIRAPGFNFCPGCTRACHASPSRSSRKHSTVPPDGSRRPISRAGYTRVSLAISRSPERSSAGSPDTLVSCHLPSARLTTSRREAPRGAGVWAICESGRSKSKSDTSMRLNNLSCRCQYNDARMRLWPGSPSPLGATWDGAGVNFAIFSAHATAVDLCLFDTASDRLESVSLPLQERTDCVWHGYLPGARPGLLYGFRIDGPWDPARGLRFNRHKLLLDPYARAIGRDPLWHPSLFAYQEGSDGDGPADVLDSAPYAPLSVVTTSAFDWSGDAPTRVPWHQTVIY